MSDEAEPTYKLEGIEGFPLADVLGEDFLNALCVQYNDGKQSYRNNVDGKGVTDLNEGDTEYNNETELLDVTCVYQINETGNYVIAAGELLGPDKYGFHGFDPAKLQVQTIWGEPNERITAEFSLDVGCYWAYATFDQESDIPTLPVPGPLLGIKPTVDALKLVNPYIKVLSQLLAKCCSIDKSLFDETGLEEFKTTESVINLIKIGLLTFILRNMADAILVDDQFSESEREFIFPLSRAICTQIAETMGLDEYSDLDEEHLVDFLQEYYASENHFCFANGEDTTWYAVAQIAGNIAHSRKFLNDPRPATLLHDLFCAIYCGILSIDGISEKAVSDFTIQKSLIFGQAAQLGFLLCRPMSIHGFEDHWERASRSTESPSELDQPGEPGGWEFRETDSNQGDEEGRDRSYLLVPLDSFIESSELSSQESQTIEAAKDSTWWDDGWDSPFKAIVGSRLDALGFCDNAADLGLVTIDMGTGPSFTYRMFRVHESFLSLDQKIGDLPQHEGEWFIMIYDKEEGTNPYNRLCDVLQVDSIDRYHWSVWE